MTRRQCTRFPRAVRNNFQLVTVPFRRRSLDDFAETITLSVFGVSDPPPHLEKWTRSLCSRAPFLSLPLCFAGHFSPGPIINERKHIINIASLSLCCRRRGMIPHPPLHLCQSLTGERTEGREDPCHVGIDSAALSFSSEFLHNFFNLLLPMTGPNRRRKSTCTHTAIVMPSVLTHCFSPSDFV